MTDYELALMRGRRTVGQRHGIAYESGEGDSIDPAAPQGERKKELAIPSASGGAADITWPSRLQNTNGATLAAGRRAVVPHGRILRNLILESQTTTTTTAVTTTTSEALQLDSILGQSSVGGVAF